MNSVAPGSTIGGYRLEELLGDGGFGEVWRATEIATGHVVALKILSGRYGSDEADRLRSDVEILAAAAVGKDPHVVTVIGGGVDPTPYIVMEYVPGESLAARLARVGWLPMAETVRIGQAIAAALVALSRAGIVHRDLKAANVLLGSDGSVKLADFGIAKIVGFDSLTATGQLPMSLHYAAPEVWEGKGGEPADRYAFGVLLYECLTGHPPFRGGYVEVFRGHRELEPDLAALPPETPAALRSLIGECLAKEPDARPPDNPMLRRTIDAIAAGLAPARATHPPAAFGPWRLVAPHQTLPWTWRAERDGTKATVEVLFGELALGESLRRAVAANPDLVPLGAERLFGANRLILHPDEAWPSDAEPGGPFAFWVAREDIPVPAATPRLDREALRQAVGSLVALRDAARAHEVALDFCPERLSLLPDGGVYLRRPGLPGAAQGEHATVDPALTTLARCTAPRQRKVVESASSLDALAKSLGGEGSTPAGTVLVRHGPPPPGGRPNEAPGDATATAAAGWQATPAELRTVAVTATAHRDRETAVATNHGTTKGPIGPAPSEGATTVPGADHGRTRRGGVAVAAALAILLLAITAIAASVLRPSASTTPTPRLFANPTAVATSSGTSVAAPSATTVDSSGSTSPTPYGSPSASVSNVPANVTNPSPTPVATPRPTQRPVTPTPTLPPTPALPTSSWVRNVAVSPGSLPNQLIVAYDWGYSGDHGATNIFLYAQPADCTIQPGQIWDQGGIRHDIVPGTNHAVLTVLINSTENVQCQGFHFWFLDAGSNAWDPDEGANWAIPTSWVKNV